MLHARPHLRGPLIAGVALLVGCTLPRDGATGIELRWRLPEGDPADAAGADPRLRSCGGALVTEVVAELVDRADPSRRRSFTYPCEAGDSAPDLVREAAHIFIDLRPGAYVLALRWSDDPADRDAEGPPTELGRLEQTVAVAADSITALDLDLPRPRLPWTLDLRGTAACERVALEIYYDDPDSDLHGLPADAGGRYRTDLVSDHGLRLADPVPCATLVDGPQRFPALDRGRYRLRLAVDGRACERDFTVAEAAVPLAVDLAKPGCAG